MNMHNELLFVFFVNALIFSLLEYLILTSVIFCFFLYIHSNNICCYEHDANAIPLLFLYMISSARNGPESDDEFTNPILDHLVPNAFNSHY